MINLLKELFRSLFNITPTIELGEDKRFIENTEIISDLKFENSSVEMKWGSDNLYDFKDIIDKNKNDQFETNNFYRIKFKEYFGIGVYIIEKEKRMLHFFKIGDENERIDNDKMKTIQIQKTSNEIIDILKLLNLIEAIVPQEVFVEKMDDDYFNNDF